MKKLIFLLMPFLILIISSSCTENPTEVENYNSAEISDMPGALTASQVEEREYIIMKMKEAGKDFSYSLNKTDGDITYIAEICNGTTPGVGLNSIWSAEDWSYYSFTGTAGAVVNITVNRTSRNIDPTFTLFFGTTTTSIGIVPSPLFDPSANNPDLVFLKYRDDNIIPLFDPDDSGCYEDPQLLDYTLPSDGEYTLAVYDFNSCGEGESTYEIEISGLDCGTLPPDPLSPAEKIAGTITELGALLSGAKTDKELEKAIKEIEKSLDPKNWIDDTHLDPKKGKEVFDDLKKAVKELEKLEKDKKADPGLKLAVEAIIETWVSVSREFAESALAGVICSTGKCEKEVEKAYKELYKAEEEYAKKHWDHAIDKFQKVWEHVQKTLKHISLS